MPSKGLPPVVEITHEDFAAWRSVCAVPRVYHVTHLGGISPANWQTIPCKRARKTASLEYLDLACRGLNFTPPDCAY